VDANWRKIDELREKYWSRDEQSRFREEIKSDMKALEDRVITAIRDTTNQIRADLRERRGGDSNE
jgi:iron uptake system EfeUOB component EfeO/EfeM